LSDVARYAAATVAVVEVEVASGAVGGTVLEWRAPAARP
jgi:hypothetical protein